ncbi:hypothetical protein COLO4_12790 [Corchorus olitorius]|uniref:Uncharacterized protein n=1 Tax=Corchorus olitorius TaxID=93759 RepID=A0A1R3JZK8_9ROSI|nr:hypothetical protein COLO4_12790 [Corchorus olitorius]
MAKLKGGPETRKVGCFPSQGTKAVQAEMATPQVRSLLP